MPKKMKTTIQTILPWIGIAVMLYFMTALQFPMLIKNLFLVAAASVCLYLTWKENSINKWEILILLSGLFLRTIVAYLNVYHKFELPIGGGNDGLAFMDTAVEYVRGDFHREYTKYPYILYLIFQITGIDQFAAQYVNVICWAFAALLLQKTCRRLEISEKLTGAALLIFAVLPVNIWMSAILYRDTLIMLALFASFYALLCWMQEDSAIFIAMSLAAVLFATWLHGGSIVAAVPIGVTVLFYSRQEGCFKITKKNIICTIILLVCAILVFLIPQTRELFLRRLPNMENGVLNGLNRWLAMKYDYSEGAGSNYMEGRYVKGYFDLIIFTIQKIYYHMFSPVPHLWRGLTDAIAFFGSSAIVYLFTTILWAVSYCYKRIDAYRFVLFMENFITIGIYAWGNVNGGTAVRHREKILGLMLLLAMYSLKLILQERKEQKNREKITEH